MKKYTDHSYADCPEPDNHHKAAHRLVKEITKPAPAARREDRPSSPELCRSCGAKLAYHNDETPCKGE